MICPECDCPGADVLFNLWHCPNRACVDYDRKLREQLDEAIGVYVRTYGIHDPVVNGAKVSVIARWLGERKAG